MTSFWMVWRDVGDDGRQWLSTDRWVADPSEAVALTAEEVCERASEVDGPVGIVPEFEASDWLEVLRRECDRVTVTAVARQLGVSRPLLSRLLAGKYHHNPVRFRALVEGILMGVTVPCPVLGDLNRADCVHWQGQGVLGSNPVLVQLSKTCPDCDFNLCRGI